MFGNQIRNASIFLFVSMNAQSLLAEDATSSLGTLVGKLADILRIVRIFIFIGAALMLMKLAWDVITASLKKDAKDIKVLSMEQVFWTTVGFLLLFGAGYVVGLFIPTGVGDSGASGYLQKLNTF